ncbi:PDZ domain-containing protein [Streptomyces tagetis]|uniref:PDZ domain-containing protein n=1 Tax=Streptomyces tagetis TaxID=2820809 RepID=A0A940XDD0_9ACTN|nr:PDZ domain-containing protein [Streptomyces sp. RG38]MBQ0825352.1 PDZ domain-containing protein [Streptomyces sp. RG38]
MEQTALRPKPMPGRDPGTGTTPGPDLRPPPVRRGRRRPVTVLLATAGAVVLLLAGVGLGTVGTTLLGAHRLAGQPGPAGAGAPAQGPAADARAAPAPPSAGTAPGPASDPAPPTATLGVEAVDDRGPGALVVGVHVPGPGYTAGLVRGDVLLTFGTTRVDSAADLARAVARAAPGTPVKVTVRHAGGGYQMLTAVPGVVT